MSVTVLASAGVTWSPFVPSPVPWSFRPLASSAGSSITITGLGAAVAGAARLPRHARAAAMAISLKGRMRVSSASRVFPETFEAGDANSCLPFGSGPQVVGLTPVHVETVRYLPQGSECLEGVALLEGGEIV